MKDLKAITTTGTDAMLSETVVATWRENLRGELLCPDDVGYDEARSLWNARFDKRPALIVRCADAADVIQSVNFARTHGIPVAVRGGGHNVAGNGACDGGLLLDMSRMKNVQVDPLNCIAHAEPGLTWGEFDRATQAHGLATTGGICSQAGIAGVTLGGGFGWLMRKYGLALDNLLSLDIVCADGELRTASATENADLFFGVRGTHSNLGIVTSLQYQLYPVGPTVLAGMVLHPLAKGKEVLRFYRDYTSQAPEDLSAWAALLCAPDGSPMVAILACYIGKQGDNFVRPLKEYGPPLMDMIQPMSYINAQSLVDESFPKGRHNYWKSQLLRELSDDVIDVLVEGFQVAASPYTSILIEQLGGAMSRVSRAHTAFPHRDAAYDVVIMPMWTEVAESAHHMQWANELWDALEPSSSGDVYVNYLSNEGEARIKAAYGNNYEQLVALKHKYDPMNLFCFNQNIK